MLCATLLDTSDEALPFGMRRYVGRVYAAAGNGRMQTLADQQTEQAKTLEEMRAELAQVRILAEQAQAAGSGEAVDRLAEALLGRIDARIDARPEDIQMLAETEPRRSNVVGWPLNPRR